MNDHVVFPTPQGKDDSPGKISSVFPQQLNAMGSLPIGWLPGQLPGWLPGGRFRTTGFGAGLGSAGTVPERFWPGLGKRLMTYDLNVATF